VNKRGWLLTRKNDDKHLTRGGVPDIVAVASPERKVTKKKKKAFKRIVVSRKADLF